MADKKPIINIETRIDQKGLDKGLDEVKKKVHKTGEEGSSVFKEMFEALAVEKVVEKGFEVVKDFFKESIEGAKDAQLNTVQLQNALATLGRSSDLKDLGDDAEELGKKFAIPKDQITKSQTALVSYGKLTTKQIKDLEPVIINFSRKTGKSMEESTNDIIKGLNGQGRELKKLGVDIKAGGTTAANYTTIIDKLGAKVAGSADAFNKTAAGGMARFKTTLEELEVSVGEKLLPAIADLTSSFTPLLEQIAPLVDEIVPTLVTLMKSLAPLFASLGGVIIKVMKPVVEIFAVVADALADLMPSLTPVIDAFGELASVVISLLLPPIKQIVGVFSTLLKIYLPPLRMEFQLLSKIFSIVARVSNDIYKIVAKLVGKLVDMFTSSKKAGDGMNFFNKIIVKITDSLKAAYKWVSELLTKIEGWLGIDDKKNGAADSFKDAGDAAQDAGNKIQGADNEVDKNAEKLAKKAEARRKKEEKAAAKDAKQKVKDSDKEIEELRKHEETLDGIKKKYYESDRQKVADGYDDDLAKLDITNKADMDLYLQLLDSKAAALQKYDDDAEKSRQDALAQELQDFIDEGEKEKQAHKDKLEKEKEATLKQISDIAGYEQQAMQAASALADLSAQADKNRLQAGQKLSVATQKKEFNTKKLLSEVSAVMSIAQGVSSALAEQDYVGAGVIAALGAAQIAKIAGQRFEPDGGGSSTSTSSAPSAPSISMSAGQTLGLGQQSAPSVQQSGLQYQKVYVTATDINKQQNKISVTNNRTKFG